MSTITSEINRIYGGKEALRLVLCERFGVSSTSYDANNKAIGIGNKATGTDSVRLDDWAEVLLNGTTVKVDNKLTITSSGGAAAGATFDGSAPVTIDYSTVGAASSGHDHDSRYLKLSGGQTVNNTQSDTAFYVQGNGNTNYIGFKNSSGTDSQWKVLELNNIKATFATDVYSDSDIRYKNILEHINPIVEDISKLPMFKYIWMDGLHSTKVLIGSSAQDVEKILPELVVENETGFKSLSYATLGAIAGITACREIIKTTSRIEYLENRIKELELKLLKYD